MQLFADPKALLGASDQPKLISVSDLITKAKSGGIKEAKWQLNMIKGTLADGKTQFESRVGDQNSNLAPTIINAFEESHTSLATEDAPAITNVLSILSVIAFPLMIGVM